MLTNVIKIFAYFTRLPITERDGESRERERGERKEREVCHYESIVPIRVISLVKCVFESEYVWLPINIQSLVKSTHCSPVNPEHAYTQTTLHSKQQQQQQQQQYHCRLAVPAFDHS